ncbi:MAG TPA: sodium:solute symporter [Thermoanaerobaculia bacterium]
MSRIDWLVLVSSLLFIVVYGLWKGRRSKDLDGYILADRNHRWYTVALSIMATQASAITFLSTPGQAYTDGMRFVQFYFGLPIAMVILSITFVPIFHRLKVYTAYEFLEQRFDLKTRTLASVLFLIQRGLGAGFTIYAPALILSVILGWNIHRTIVVIGALVILYTASGGTKAVNHTNFQQMLIILAGMVGAFVVVIASLPKGVGMLDATYVAGKLGRLNAIDFSFDPSNRYNFWSGLIGGCFLALSYFGTDQSQVGRYLAGQSIAQSRLGLLFNGMVKIPMQFFILFVGAMVFAFYQFITPPLFFNPVETDAVRTSTRGAEFHAIEERFRRAAAERKERALALVSAMRSDDDRAIAMAEEELERANETTAAIRGQAIDLMKANRPKADPNDTNYVFLTFVMHHLPVGLIGLVMAAVFAASMSSTSSELNALSSTTVVDIYKRMVTTAGSDKHYVLFSKLATVGWGVVAILFANFANRLGSLVEAVNLVGSIFYGTILGIFLVAFYCKRVGGTATFIAGLVALSIVVWFYFFTTVAFLWYNLIGCVVVIVVAIAINGLVGRDQPLTPDPSPRA